MAFLAPLDFADHLYSQAKRKLDAEAKVGHLQLSLAFFFDDTLCSLKFVQVLLLGPGDSGKSTVIKQMRILTKVPWTYIELESYRQIIFLNLIDGMKRMIQSLEELGTSLKGDPRALDAYKVNHFPPSSFSL